MENKLLNWLHLDKSPKFFKLTLAKILLKCLSLDKDHIEDNAELYEKLRNWIYADTKPMTGEFSMSDEEWKKKEEELNNNNAKIIYDGTR